MEVRIGFIGVGGMAEHHIKTLQNVEHAKVSAVFDINQTRANEIAETYGATAFTTSDALLESGQVDAIFICTPPFARNDVEAVAAKKGIHVLVEKPIGLDLEQIRKNEKVILESGVIHSSGYCLRYLDTVHKAKEYLADKQVDLVMAYRFGGRPPMAWWSKLEQSGGQLVEQSTHQLDLIRYVVGDFKEVYAIHEQRYIQNIDPTATAYDVGTVSFTLKSGAIGNITSTCLAKYVGSGEIEIFGHDFYVSINGKKLRIKDDNQDITMESDYDFYYEQDKAFVNAIRQKRQDLVLCNYSEAVTTLEVTLGANDSAAARQLVSFS